MPETLLGPERQVIGESAFLSRLHGVSEDWRLADAETQAGVDKMQRVDWINHLAPWEITATFTFRWESSLDSTRRIFEKFMRRKFGRLSYYYAIEPNPNRYGNHVHSLWADASGVFRREAWAAWFQRYGRAKIEPVKSPQDSAQYASKYLCKADAWWNCKLQWHRLQGLNERDFRLCESPSA